MTVYAKNRNRSVRKYFINETVFIKDFAQPHATVLMFQCFAFAKAIEWNPVNSNDPFKNLFCQMRRNLRPGLQIFESSDVKNNAINGSLRSCLMDSSRHAKCSSFVSCRRMPFASFEAFPVMEMVISKSFLADRSDFTRLIKLSSNSPAFMRKSASTKIYFSNFNSIA